MSQTPCSKPDVNDVVSSSPVFKIRPSLNHWSGGRLPKERGKRLFGLVIIALLLLGLQLTACGNAAPSPIGSASPTSNSTSQPIIPSTTSAPGSTTASTTTAGPTTTVPTTGPTTGLTSTPTTGSTSTPTAVPTSTPTTGSTSTPTAVPTITPTPVPTPDPSSFSVTQLGATICFTSQDVTKQTPQSIQIEYNGSDNPTPGPINWTVSTQVSDKNNLDCGPCTPDDGSWLSFNPPSGSISYGTTNDPVALQASPMPVGVYCTKIQFSVNPDQNFNPGKAYAYAELTIVPPGVSSISPASGPAAGSTSVTITGSNFTGATVVSFGSTAAGGFTVNSDTQITATSPAGSGTVDVTVTDSFGTSTKGAADQFTYISAPSGPVVSSVSPTSGPAVGGTSVTITGTGFTGATGVSFGSTAASSFTANGDTQITAVSPAGSGTVDVTVTTPNGTSATGTADQFTYT